MKKIRKIRILDLYGCTCTQCSHPLATPMGV